MRTAAMFVMLAALAGAQEQKGGIQGTVADSVSDVPVKKVQVLVFRDVSVRSRSDVGSEPAAAITDNSGAFSIRDLAPGTYEIRLVHPTYPAFASAREEVKAGEATRVSMELVPGASITGRVLDADGDPIMGCMVDMRSPAGNYARAGSAMGQRPSNENGEYRIWGIGAGRYTLSARCSQPVFEPRPFSAGPPKPPTLAYPVQFYPLASDVKSADIVELAPGMEKTGVDFHMRVARVYSVRGTLTSMGADWRSRDDLRIILVPQGGERFNPGAGASIDRAKGTFEARAVFPGSYVMTAATMGESEGRLGGRRVVEVGDGDVEADLTLLPAQDLKGTIEVEGDKKVPLKQAAVQLMPADTGGSFGLASGGRVNEDGTFTLKSVLPSVWRVQVSAPGTYVKAVSLGDQDGQDGVIDTTAGGGTALRIVLGTRMANIRGSGTPGQFVAVAVRQGNGWQMVRTGFVRANGDLTMTDVPPGKYKLFVMDRPGPIPEEGGQDITLREGETLNVELKSQESAR